ncbi:hypothetical protein [Mongoliitalea lutea]|uniref:Lipoprotein n=1 Tax=Mongoliitalea lutea TaxID=849756 RepID=A0A8J3CWX3_9BACT|nr:hypothetical protein [Mongoliitalea lutea]GHB41301.1 hypothetical protein GCM10008106_23030 [Mongoliitalea lutea]
MKFKNKFLQLGLILSLLFLFSCRDEDTPDTENYFFEVEIEDQVLRQEFSKNLSLDGIPLVFKKNKSSSIGQINSQLENNCLISCILPFYVNMVFDGSIGTREIEVLETLDLPIGTFTTHFWFGNTNVNPEPSKIWITITEADEAKKVIRGTFEGETYKNLSETPVKIPIRGEFKAAYLIN